MISDAEHRMEERNLRSGDDLMYDVLPENSSGPKRFYLPAALTLIAAGAAAGAFFMALRFGGSAEMGAYLEETASRLAGAADAKAAALGTARECAAVLAVFFICSFVRPGAVVIAAELLRRGFVTGFTVAAFAHFRGTAGVMFMLPRAVIFTPAFAALGAAAAGAALSGALRGKKSR